MVNLTTTPRPGTKATPKPTADCLPSGRDGKLDAAVRRKLLQKLGCLIRELNDAELLMQLRRPLKEIEQGITDA